MGIAVALTLGEGGPLRRLERRCHLTSSRTQVLAALVISWLPLVVFGFATELSTGERVRLLHDMTVHVRMLVAAPLLVFLDYVFPLECRYAIRALSSFDIIKAADRARFEQLLQRTTRLGDWWLPETALAVVAFGLGIATLRLPVGGIMLRSGLTATDWWYALVALPLFEFLLLRSFWRWMIWVRFLIGLARIKLDLDPTHPDKHGGIAILRKPSLTYCATLLFVVSAVTSAQWSARFQFVSMASFVPLLLVFAVVAILVAFGPLLLFVTQMFRARREALVEVGSLAARNGRWFRNRWTDTKAGTVLSSAEPQNLVAIASTYRDSVAATRIWPFQKRDLLLVLAATLLPVVPIMLVRIPHEEWFSMASLLVGAGGFP